MSRLLAVLLLLCPVSARAGSRLLYLEAQGVAGYSSAKDGPLYNSAPDRMEVMQKPSVGADCVQQLSTERREWGSLYVQARLAYDREGHGRLEPQLYNAFLRSRFRGTYAWIGHNRVAAGLESYLDTHTALMQVLSMYGAGFDRDWGAGVSRDFSRGDAALSLTTGSGMPVVAGRGGRLLSLRASGGVLRSDNYNVGAYYSGGRIPDVAGTHVMDAAPRPYDAFGADGSLLWDRFELRADARAGEKFGAPMSAVLGRLGVKLLDEDRLKLEVQAVFTRLGETHDRFLALGASYVFTPELTGRAMFEHARNASDKRAILQLHYYLNL